MGVGGPPPATGSRTRTVFYAVGPGPNPEIFRGPTLYAARARARRGGKGWEISSSQETIEQGAD